MDEDMVFVRPGPFLGEQFPGLEGGIFRWVEGGYIYIYKYGKGNPQNPVFLFLYEIRWRIPRPAIFFLPRNNATQSEECSKVAGEGELIRTRLYKGLIH